MSNFKIQRGGRGSLTPFRRSWLRTLPAQPSRQVSADHKFTTAVFLKTINSEFIAVSQRTKIKETIIYLNLFAKKDFIWPL